jgi:hypothetical protein
MVLMKTFFQQIRWGKYNLSARDLNLICLYGMSYWLNLGLSRAASLDKIFFFLAAGFPDQKFPANIFYKYEFWL